MAEYKPSVARAEGAGGEDILLTLEAVELRSDSARYSYPPRKDKGEQQAREGSHLIRQMHLEQGSDDDERDGREDIGNTLHREVDGSAVVTGYRAPDNSDEEVELELQTTDSYNDGLEDGYSACLLEILKNINVENKE